MRATCITFGVPLQNKLEKENRGVHAENLALSRL